MKNALHLPIFSILLWNSEQENILQTITYLVQYTVLVIQFWSVKYTTVTVEYAKISSNISFHPIQATQAITMVRIDENKPLQKPLKRIWHCIYLFKFYNILIIIFLKNNLTNICGKISKIRMNLWMVCICNMKSSGKYNTKRWKEGECNLNCWPNHQKSVIIVDHSRNVKGI